MPSRSAYPIAESDEQWTDDEEPVGKGRLQGGFLDSVVEEVGSAPAPLNETLLQRIAALKYIFPFAVRSKVSSCYGILLRRGRQVFRSLRTVAWVVATSLILVGLPIIIENDREQGLIAYEKERGGDAASGSDQLL